MRPGTPRRIRLQPDRDPVRYTGRTAAGLQYMLTTPPEYLVVYLFDEDGHLLEARIDELGAANHDEQARRDLEARRLAELGTVSLEEIEFAPFSFERFGTRFGFVAQAPAHEGAEWRVIAEPGQYMAFTQPWSGLTDRT